MPGKVAGVSAAQHSSPGDKSFYVSLVRHLASAVVLVALVAAAFWAVGQVRGDTPAGVAINDAPQPVTGVAPTGDSSTTGQTSAEPPPGDPLTAAPTSAPTSDPTAAPTQPPPTEAPTSSPPPTESGVQEVPPGETSIQVLDAAGDGGAAAQRVADELTDAGYDIVVVQSAAVSYDLTTVFWSTADTEAQARQLAAALGSGEVAPKPDNLADTVDVHVVVGQDEV